MRIDHLGGESLSWEEILSNHSEMTTNAVRSLPKMLNHSVFMLYETIYNAHDTDLPFRFVFPSVSLTSVAFCSISKSPPDTKIQDMLSAQPSPLIQNIPQMTIEVEPNTEQESTKEQEVTEHPELEQTSVMDKPVVQPVQNQKRKCTLIAVGLTYLIWSRNPRKGDDTSDLFNLYTGSQPQ